MNISHFTALFSHTPDLTVFHFTGYHEFSERESHFRDLNKCTYTYTKKLHQISENNKTFLIKIIIATHIEILQK